MAAFADLIREGKVRAIGASNFGAPRLAKRSRTSERLGLPRYESLQPLYNVVDRAAYEDALEKVCVDNGLGVINFYGARERLSDRQVPQQGRPRQERRAAPTRAST